MTEREDSYIAGNTTGGKKSAQKIQAKDPDFFKRIGSIGGKAPTTKPKGFAANLERARAAGAISGKISRKGHKLLERTETSGTYQRLSDGAIVEIKY